jgi:hypothetical protein
VTPVTDVEAVRFGDQTPPDGPILAVRVEDLSEKDAVLAALAVAVIAFVVFLVAQASLTTALTAIGASMPH